MIKRPLILLLLSLIFAQAAQAQNTTGPQSSLPDLTGHSDNSQIRNSANAANSDGRPDLTGHSDNAGIKGAPTISHSPSAPASSGQSNGTMKIVGALVITALVGAAIALVLQKKK